MQYIFRNFVLYMHMNTHVDVREFDNGRLPNAPDPSFP